MAYPYDGSSLPYPKTDKTPLAGGEDPTKNVVAADWNTYGAALDGLRNAVEGVARASGSTPGILQGAAGFVNVLDKGAVGDGVADDTAAIQAAITAAVAGGWGLYFPLGKTFKTTSTLTVTSGNRLRISGYGATINSSAGSSSAALLLSGCTGCSVDGLKVVGASSTKWGVRVTGGSSNKVRDCDISGITANGGAAGIFLSNTSDVWVLNNYLHGNGNGSAYQDWDIATDNGELSHERVYLAGNTCVSSAVTINVALFNVAHARVIGNHVANAIQCDANPADKINGYGIMLYTAPGGASGSNLVYGNTIKDVQGLGIYMQTQPNSAVVGNYLENVNTVLVNASLLIGAIAFTGNSDANDHTGTIANNVIKGAGSGGVISAGIVFEGPNTSVQGNSIRDCTGAGVFMNGSPHKSTVSGNSITATAHGILSDGTALNGVTISGNTVNATTGVTYGINLPANASDFTISGNTVDNAGGSGISAPGGVRGTIVGNNVRNPSQGSAGAYPGIEITTNTSTLVCANTSTGSSANFNIREGGTGNEVCNNVCIGGSVAEISIGGTAAEVHDNRFSAGARSGTATLSGGTITVSTVEIRTGDRVEITRKTRGGTPGNLAQGTITNATSVVIDSDSGTDTSVVYWRIVH